MKGTLKDRFLLFIVLPLFWGSTFLATKICLVDLSPVWMAAIRYSLSTLVFFIFLLRKFSFWRTVNDLKNHWWWFVAVGLVGTFFAAFFQNIGLKYTTASVSSLINTLEPVLVAIMSVIFLREKLTPTGVLGLGIAFIGGFILISGGDPTTILSLQGSVKGNFLILLSIISYAFYTIFSKILVSRTDPLTAVTYSTLIGAITLIIGALLLEDFPTLRAVSLMTWSSVVYLAFFPTCLSLFLFNKLLTQVEASRVSIILFLIPLYGLVLGVILLKEPLTVAMIGGGIMTLFGVWLIEYGPARKSRKKREKP